ncbi:hypothetical protein K402DRAFT_416032 [Aulographum hederae CBS 113979]|uniref:Peptidase A1 domain-containing protein n=1 Tax=Aulographum hederae CBS 113979 TaxID=1176131 RepID=A0A6G1HH52_9PEZI|nr:hypothetical protein K402DRAFT_416032 [Aulographum hederae CBS 113979]
MRFFSPATILLAFSATITSSSTATRQLPPGIHFTLSRRGGPFYDNGADGNPDFANLTFLAQQLEIAEARFDQTRRVIRGNRVVRVPKQEGRHVDDRLLGEVGREGSWFVKMKMGNVQQEVEFDIDMLASDISIRTTTSDKGSRFDEIWSESYTKSRDVIFPHCFTGSDSLSVPNSNDVRARISFPHCRPPHVSLDTLLPSGNTLGLAASESLSQMQPHLPRLLRQLIGAEVIEKDQFSIMLLNGHEGVLSIGGTAANVVRAAVKEAEDKLKRLGEVESKPVESEELVPSNFTIVKRDRIVGKQLPKKRVNDIPKHDLDGWKWSTVEGAAGWWQLLLRGVWINGVKVMRNQPAVIDLSTPFILAPPTATRTFYASIPGSIRLPAPHASFHAFPCLNAPSVGFEFAGDIFPVLKGRRTDNAEDGENGGRTGDVLFSLGRVGRGSGYCVGAVVETGGGVGVEVGGHGRRKGGQRVMKGGEDEDDDAGEEGMLAEHGIRDTWVLGELGFRGLGMAFDYELMRVGFQSY